VGEESSNRHKPVLQSKRPVLVDTQRKEPSKKLQEEQGGSASLGMPTRPAWITKTMWTYSAILLQALCISSHSYLCTNLISSVFFFLSVFYLRAETRDLNTSLTMQLLKLLIRIATFLENSLCTQPPQDWCLESTRKDCCRF
jgi:hypothetical protein